MQLYIGALCLTLLAIPTLVLTQSDISCFTPIGEPGYCVPSNQCQFVLDLQNLYKGKSVPRAINNQLRQMACHIGQRSGFHLCCPSPQVITAQSNGNRNRNTITTTRQPPAIRQATGDLQRIDPRGLKLLNSVTECGKRLNAKVSGGEVTKIGEFPWLVLLKYDSTDQPFRCGGTLISDRFVLTAAHCITMSIKLIGVRMGEHNLDEEEDCQILGGRVRDCLPPTEEYDIEDIRSHPNYNFINNDIALIKLDRPVKFKRHIKPICLPIERNSQSLDYDQNFFIAGWGNTDKSDDRSAVLRKAFVKRQDLDYCRNYYVDAPVNNNHICAAGDSIAHTCKGDSGGPLFFLHNYKETLRYVQYGIVSYGGQRCGRNSNQPGVFSSVIDLLPWITQNLY